MIAIAIIVNYMKIKKIIAMGTLCDNRIRVHRIYLKLIFLRIVIFLFKTYANK